MGQSDVRLACISAVAAPVLLGLCFAGCYGCSRVPVSDGYRDGTVRKVSQTGVIWKTWEVEMLGDGLRGASAQGGGTISPETFNYSVSDNAVVETLQKLKPGQRVRLHYRKNLSQWSPSGETPYFVTAIDELKD